MLVCAQLSFAYGDENAPMAGQIVILHTNDTHGRDNDAKTGMTLEGVTAVKQYYESQGATVFLLSAGDTFHGLPFATLSAGSDEVKLMNLAGYDAMTPGNHDFNYGYDRLKELEAEADFEIISANALEKATSTEAFTPYIILEANGKTIGVFGLSTPETAFKTSPKNVEALTFADPLEAAKATVAQLQAENVDVIVALAHIGTNDASSPNNSQEILNAVEGIDIYIDGHSHSVFEKDTKIGNTLINSAGEYYKNLGVVTINADGTMSADKLTTEQVKEMGVTDPKMAEALTAIVDAQGPELKQVVATVAVDFDGVRENVRTKQTNLGALAADAILWATDADIAFTNGGGIRASLATGPITKEDVITVFPFGNYIMTKVLPGETIVEALEQSVSALPGESGGFLQVSGISFDVDPSQPVGGRVSNVMVNGAPLSLTETYLCASNDFTLNSGGDGYTMLAQHPIANEFSALEEVLASYLKAFPDAAPSPEGRVNIAAGAEPEAITEDVTEDAAAVTEAVEAPVVVETTAEQAEVPAPVLQPTQNETPVSVTTYVVQKGDYLVLIAETVYGDGTMWRQIYNANKNIIGSPDRIYPGQELLIP